MSILLPATEVTRDNLLQEVVQLKQQNYRLITLTCLDTGQGHDVIYHFAKQYDMVHLRLHLAAGTTLASISALFPSAMIVENEIKDHFGVHFEGLTFDFKGRLMLSENAPRAPMNKRCGMGIDARTPEKPAPAPANPPSTEGLT